MNCEKYLFIWLLDDDFTTFMRNIYILKRNCLNKLFSVTIMLKQGSNVIWKA